MHYDLIIIGGGPAGVAAGVYASRKQLKTIFITEEWGGQSAVSPEIQNWIGTIAIPGTELAKNLRAHLEAYAKDIVTIQSGVRAERAEKTDGGFSVTTSDGSTYTARALLLATGAHRRRLPVPGADEFEHKGLTYCASCDGPIFAGMDVAVVGGGNAGFETAAQLLAYAKSVTLLSRGDSFKADPVTVEKVSADPKMKTLLNTEPTEVRGDAMVTGLAYKNNKTGETGELAVKGIFVEIGLVPTTGFVKDLVSLDEHKRIVVDPKNQRASLEGVWAAGDCTNELYHQNNIAAGDAVKALEDIYLWLKAR